MQLRHGAFGIAACQQAERIDAAVDRFVDRLLFFLARRLEHEVDDILAARAGAPDTVACPRCGSHHTQEISRFASTACKALYRCLDCREPFDYFKPY